MISVASDETGPQRVSRSERRRTADGGTIVDHAYRLPDAARRKLQELRLESDAGNARVRVVLDVRENLNAKLLRLREIHVSLLTPTNVRAPDGHYGRGLTNAADEVKEVATQISDTEAELRLVAEKYKAAVAMAGATGVGHVEEYIARRLAPGSVRLAATIPTPSLDAGQTVFDAIEELRRRRRELRARLAKARVAPIHSDEAKRLAREQIAKLAEHGRPDVCDLVERGGQIAWPQDEKSRPAFLDQAGYRELPAAPFDALAAFAWLHQKNLIASIEREIERVADDKSALSDEQRKKLTAVIQGDILALEYNEEALIMLSERNGQPLPRRPLADPRAVLWLASDMPAPEERIGVEYE